jgi:hypothetical protein
MAIESKNSSLAKARDAKQDEFYTQLSDIEKELKHYKKHFKGKVVYCNCDDPRISGFFHYFSYNFEKLGLKKLITTCYKSSERDLFSKNNADAAIMLEYTGDKDNNNVPDPKEIGIVKLKGDGDFRSEESIELLKQADIVVTNPPFSLFREYVNQLLDYDKKFIIVGTQNAITYKDVFPHIMANRIWLGNGFTAGNAYFRIPPENARNYASGVYDEKTGLVKFRNVCWFTNLDISKRHEELILYRKFTADNYPSYDNYDAIEVDKVKDIPCDYDGIMGVPITFLEKHNPDQFEIVGVTQSWSDGRTKTYPKQTQVGSDGKESLVTKLNDGAAIKLNSPPVGKTYYKVDGNYYVKVYARVLIRRK